MKGFKCKMCGFISINGRAPEKCPVCGAPKTAFEEKDDAIKLPKDPSNLTELEKKHIPVIKVDSECCSNNENCKDVYITIGEILHPMQPEHSIIHMDCYIDKEFISRIHLTPDKLNPAAGLCLKSQSGKLSVIDFCNLHGNWIKEAEL